MIAVALAATPAVTRAHGGGLNKQGCHNERATGGYHCHRGGYSAVDVGHARNMAEKAHWERQKAHEEMQAQRMRQQAAADWASGLRGLKSLSPSEVALYEAIGAANRYERGSGHEAGYQWAEENDVTDPGDCGGNSPSFIEGCEAWAEENE